MGTWVSSLDLRENKTVLSIHSSYSKDETVKTGLRRPRQVGVLQGNDTLLTCAHTFMYIHAQSWTHIFMNIIDTHIYAWMHACTHVCTCTYTHTHIQGVDWSFSIIFFCQVLQTHQGQVICDAWPYQQVAGQGKALSLEKCVELLLRNDT